MTTSQEAREYPRWLKEAAEMLGLASIQAGRLIKVAQHLESAADQDADRKARQQEALDTRRLDWLEASRLKASARGFTWDSLDFDTDKPIRDQIDAAIAKGERHE